MTLLERHTRFEGHGARGGSGVRLNYPEVEISWGALHLIHTLALIKLAVRVFFILH